jgi:flagellar motor switch protein FliN/FliY
MAAARALHISGGMSNAYPSTVPTAHEDGLNVNQDTAAAVVPMATPRADAWTGPGPFSIDSLPFVVDVPVELTVELGRKKARIGDALRLGPDSVIELNKGNGEPLDVYANDRLVARAEAVVVGEHYGVRITEVLVVEGRKRSGERA